MQLNLVPHPESPPTSTELKVWASVDHAAALGAVATTNIWFGIGAPADRFVIPQSAEPARRDGLWQTTCCEAFLRGNGEPAYREWNFAPSGDWAAYDFTDYREGKHNVDVPAPPYIRMEDNLTWWGVGATITTDANKRYALGLSVVLEEKGGKISYWALAHGAAAPDFHNAACFAYLLPPFEPE